MSKDVIDILIEGQKELKKDLETIRNEMHTEHVEVLQRLTALEHSSKVTRWIYAGAGAITMLALREIIPLLL